MTFLKAILAAGAFTGAAVGAGSAWAHTSLAPHDHPHGHSLLMGDANLLIAMVAVAAIAGGLALAVGRRREDRLGAPRRRS